LVHQEKIMRTELLERATEVVLYFVFRLRRANGSVLGEEGHALRQVSAQKAHRRSRSRAPEPRGGAGYLLVAASPVLSMRDPKTDI
jgi:hypothetical protein